MIETLACLLQTPGAEAGQGYVWGLFDVSATTTKLLILSSLLFVIGVGGVLARRNIIVIFMSIELMLNAVNINLIGFSYQLQNGIGQVFAIFVIAVAAAEAAVGLGIILAFYRNKENVNIDEMNLMKW